MTVYSYIYKMFYDFQCNCTSTTSLPSFMAKAENIVASELGANSVLP